MAKRQSSPNSATQVVRQDGALINSMSGLGASGFDPRISTGIQSGKELDKGEIDNLMRWEYGCTKFVESIPNSAVRKWIRLEIQAVKKDASKRILDRLETWGVRECLRQALILERQYGGSAVIIGADDGQEISEELDLAKIQDVHYLHPVSRYKITYDPSSLEDDEMSPRFGLPIYYRLNDAQYSASNDRIHHTRLLVFQGWCPYERQLRYEWGISVLDGFWPAWRDYASTLASGIGVGNRLNETRLKIKELSKMMRSREWDAIRSMIQEIHAVRSVFRILLVDADDQIEDAALNMSGAASLVQLARENAAAASGLSLQNFFGLTREGLSDRDEGASERDDAAIAAYQEDRLLKPINRMVEIALAVEKMRVKTWQVRFQPLREEKPADVANRRQTEANTGATLINAGVVHREEVREGLRADPDAPYPLQDGSVEDAFPEDQQMPPGSQPGAPGGGPFTGPRGGQYADAGFKTPYRQPSSKSKKDKPKPSEEEEEEEEEPDEKEDAFDPDQQRDESGKWSATGAGGRATKSARGGKADSKAVVSGGVTWERRRTERQSGELVEVDIEKINSDRKERDLSYVGPGAQEGAEIEGRVEGFKEFVSRSIERGEAVEAPQLSYNDKTETPSFGDGRHRFEAWRQLGHKTIPVVVKKGLAEKIRQRYGRS